MIMLGVLVEGVLGFIVEIFWGLLTYIPFMAAWERLAHSKKESKVNHQ